MTPNEHINRFFDLTSSVVDLPSSDKEVVAAIQKYQYVLQHRLDRVEVLAAKEYQTLPDDLVELRAFSEAGELHAVSMEDGLVGRIRTDGTGEPAIAYDELHQVWGSDATRIADGRMLLSEDRGTRVYLPAGALRSLDEGQCIVVWVRNYLEEGTENPQTGDTSFAFCDWRLVGFDVRKAS